MNDLRTSELVAAWRAADGRHHRLQRRWPLVLTSMWLIAGLGAVLLIAGLPIPVALLLTLVALAVGIPDVVRDVHARNAEQQAWQALAAHTGLGDAELARLVDETENGGASS